MRNNDLFKEKLSLIPNKPGCYIMKDIDNNIIYVGKAKNLHSRVSSYFMGSHDYKTTKLVSFIEDFEYIITSNELEAFILENNLIKKHNPKYNIKQTDDKTYPYICLTKEENPRLLYTRNIDKKLGKYYGPYPNGYACKVVCERLNKLYGLRRCRSIPKSECLYYHLHQCIGPCINKIDKETYQDMCNHIDNVLTGKTVDETKYLEKKMLEASNNLDYEKAIEYRNLLDDIKIITEKQHMEGYLEDSDIFGYFVNEEYLSIQVFHLREGKILERSGFLLDNDGNHEEAFFDFIVKFYLNDNNPFPKFIYVKDVDVASLSSIISHQVIVPKKGKYKDLMDLVCVNAKNKIDEILKKKDIEYKKSNGAVIELSNLLGLPYLKTIEAFDNSNISGVSAVSGMVSFVDGKKNKKLYRRFKIKTVVGANEAKTMYEVVSRRYKDININPSLIIMDGGIIQVNSAIKALEDNNRKIPVIGLIKDDNHRTKSLYFDGKEIPIDKNSYAFKLLYNIQEEVHRYAIAYFHKTHTNNSLLSKLDSIKGIGKVKKSEILSIIGKPDFLNNLDKIKLTDVQKKEVLKIFNL